MGVPANAGNATGWDFGAGKCRGIVTWVPANARLAGLRPTLNMIDYRTSAEGSTFSEGVAFLMPANAGGSIFGANMCREQTPLPPPFICHKVYIPSKNCDETQFLAQFYGF